MSSNCRGTTLALMSAIDRCRVKRIPIVNMSLGTDTLSANMSETPTPRKFSVEGETGFEDVDQPGGRADGSGDRGGGEGGAAALHGRREAAGAARGGPLHEARRVERAVAA